MSQTPVGGWGFRLNVLQNEELLLICEEDKDSLALLDIRNKNHPIVV